MESVFGPIFSHFYMSALENKVFNTINKSDIFQSMLTTYSSPIALMKLTQYKRPFKIILISISQKRSISTMKFHFLVY